jgi:putative two-component system response regulator
MAVADVFDALISQRVYKPAMSYDQARDIITGGSGSHFDPDIVAAFLEGFDAMTAIADQYKDRGNPQA